MDRHVLTYSRTTSSDETNDTIATDSDQNVIGTPDTVHAVPDSIQQPDVKLNLPTTPNIVVSEPTNTSSEEAAQTQASLTPGFALPTRDKLPSFQNLYDYGNVTQEQLRSLAIVTRISRSDNANQYVLLSCGYWYLFEDGENVKQMKEHEYEAFFLWFEETGTTIFAQHYIDVDKKDPNQELGVHDIIDLDNNEPSNHQLEDRDSDRQQYLSPHWTPKAAN